MPVLNGNSLFVLIRNDEGGYYPIACDRTCTLSLDRAMLEICNPLSKFKSYIPGGEIESKVEGDGLVNYARQMSAAKLQQLLIAGTLVRIMMEVGGVAYEFQGYVNSISITAANKAAITFTYSITITGEVNINDEAEKEEETAVFNLLLASPDGELLDINSNDDNLII